MRVNSLISHLISGTVFHILISQGLCDIAFSNLSSIDDLWRGMQNLGVNLSKIEVEEMMQEADRDSDGKINFDEFIAMIRRT